MASPITHTDQPDQDKEEDNSGQFEDIEKLIIPYQSVLENKWDKVKEYYKQNPRMLHRQMTLQGDNVLHLAASSCSKLQCKEVLEFLIDKCVNDSDSNSNHEYKRWSTHEYKRWSLRVENKGGNNALHQVSVSGSVEAAEFLVRSFNEPITDPSIPYPNYPSADEKKHNPGRNLLWTRNGLGETPLYIAAARGHNGLVKSYMKKKPDDYWQLFLRHDKMNALRMAVIGQHFETAHWLHKSDPVLGEMPDEEGLTGLQLLAHMPKAFEPHFQQNHWKMLIYHCLPNGEDVEMDGEDVDMDGEDVEMDGEDVKKDDVESSMKSNRPRQSIFRKKLAVVMKPYYSLLDSLEGTGGLAGTIYRIWKDKKNKNALKKLIKSLVLRDDTWVATSEESSRTRTISLGLWKNPETDGDGGGKTGKAIARETLSELKEKAMLEVNKSTPLFIATVKGNVPIVQEILEQHPQAVEHINSKGHNILHLAIKNRQREILNLIVSKPTLMSMLNESIDNQGNTLLHQAADRSYYSISLTQQLIGPAMQLQEELHWFERVKRIIPPHYIIHHNRYNETANDMFNYWHDKLLEEAQKWVKDTAQSCSTVAVLVATVVFAAAYTIPGGTNGQNGLPLFQNDPLFLLFTCMDVVAIASSLSSVAFFLSVLSSPLEYPLFVSSIPNKIMAGFVLLFISMATTMLAFAATILLLIRVEKKWTKSLLYPIAFFPVPLFGLLQFPMYHSFKVVFHEINAWFFKPLLDLLCFPKKRSIWCKSKAD